MKYQTKSTLFWILSFFLMAGAAVYQRTTGPTYPVRGKITLQGEEIKYKLIRTWEGNTDAEVIVKVTNQEIEGKYRYKRYKSNDEWTEKPLRRDGDQLIATLPNQAAAGKVMYEIYLGKGEDMTRLVEKPAVLRYKGEVPLPILIIHIILIFSAMMFSMRTGIEALIKGKNLVKYSLLTVIFMGIGGMILGPIVQKYAFDAYWTGWPFGHDLTDNKTLAAFVLWVVAWLQVRKNPNKRGWVIAAAILLLAVYLIPHSTMGSEIDYTKAQ
jgi:hypothetical protein